MSSSTQDNSQSKLPTFGIRNLSDTPCSPSLISISACEYNSTIRSQPDAALHYLDEDDGETITVGSGLELKQRLDEEVPAYPSLSTRNHASGQLVHVFDITRSSGSLAVWREQEAYSSKVFRARRRSSSLSCSSLDSSEHQNPERDLGLETSTGSAMNSSDHSKDNTTIEQGLGKTATKGGKSDAEITADNIIEGLETHLDGLAQVLQIAATTLQNAAQKTRDTDTSVVEDVLSGVRNILAEVGSFGLGVFSAIEANATDLSTSNQKLPHSKVESVSDHSIAAGSKTESEAEAVVSDEEENRCSSLSPRVKFDLANGASTLKDRDRQASMPSPSINSVSSFDLQDRESTGLSAMPANLPIPESCGTRTLQPTSRPESILDHDNEDADFASRYPPLVSSVRRAQTIGSSTQRYQPYSRQHTLNDKWNPFASGLYNSTVKDHAEIVSRPLPGAWPEIKAESNCVLPTSKESSGAFFNRMTGRVRQPDEELAFGASSLRRANTTASANPASRLNGPFNPDIPFNLKASIFDDTSFAPSTLKPSSVVKENAIKRPRLRVKVSEPSLPKQRISEQKHDTVRSARSDGFNGGPGPRTSLHHARSVPHFGLYSKSDSDDDSNDKKPVWARLARKSPINMFPVSPVLPAPAIPDYLTGSDSFTKSDNTANGISRSATISTCSTKSAPKSCSLAPALSVQSLRTAQSEQARERDQVNAYRPSMNPFLDPVPGTSMNRTAGFVPSKDIRENARDSFERNHAAILDTIPTKPKPRSRPQPYSSRPSTNYTFSPTPTHAPYANPFTVTDIQGNSDDKLGACVSKLRDLGFGTADPSLSDRLHVYAVAADGDVGEAVEMIEEDRTVSRRWSREGSIRGSRADHNPWTEY